MEDSSVALICTIGTLFDLKFGTSGKNRRRLAGTHHSRGYVLCENSDDSFLHRPGPTCCNH